MFRIVKIQIREIGQQYLGQSCLTRLSWARQKHDFTRQISADLVFEISIHDDNLAHDVEKVKTISTWTPEWTGQVLKLRRAVPQLAY